jgi:hypothetical protein
MTTARLAFTCFTALFILFCERTIAQSDTRFRYMRIPKDHKARIISDQKNQISYVLDTSHIYIEALSKNGTRMWITDPWIDFKWASPPSERPIVTAFMLLNDSTTHFRNELGIWYNNLGFASMDAETGKIISIGKD